MTVVDHGPLGERSEYPPSYAPQVLHPIPRALGRAALGVSLPLPFSGIDIWNAYEVSWLALSGKPVVALMELHVPCNSPFIVESKSLKLYLGSFNNERFASVEAVRAVMLQDLARLTSAEVTLSLLSLDVAAKAAFGVKSAPGRCIDDEDIENPGAVVTPEHLSAASAKIVDETLHSHLLRSNCPVTGQPDWASVMIHYRGPAIDRAGLLAYLVSYRNHNDFHEQCVERIFWDIKRLCHPQALTVYARYTRRGGIDINPFRSDFEKALQNRRLIRQ